MPVNPEQAAKLADAAYQELTEAEANVLKDKFKAAYTQIQRLEHQLKKEALQVEKRNDERMQEISQIKAAILKAKAGEVEALDALPFIWHN